MEVLAYRILLIGDIGLLLISWLVAFASAAVAVSSIKVRIKLSRPSYFLSMGFSFLLGGISSLFVLGVQDAIKNDYLSVLVALMFGYMILVGVFTGLCAAARSVDAYGVPGKWVLGFIPIANLALLFAQPQEKRQTGFVRLAGNTVIIALSFLMMGLGKGISTSAAKQVDVIVQAIQNDPQVQNKALRYAVQANGLEETLREAAKEVQVPTKVDSITTLTGAESNNDTIRFIYGISDQSFTFSKTAQEMVTNRWCKNTNFTSLMGIGATIEGRYVSQDGQHLGEVKISTALCDQWRDYFQKTMNSAASGVKANKLDEITTLLGAEYRDGTFTYHYTLSDAPDDGWLDVIKDRWCKADQFKQMMGYDLNVRGVYVTEANTPVGEVMINSAICKAIVSSL